MIPPQSYEMSRGFSQSVVGFRYTGHGRNGHGIEGDCAA